MQPTPIALERLVVGIDFSWPSVTTMQWISRELAPEAEIVLVHALQIPELPGILQEPGTTATLVDIATEGARRRLRATRNTLGQRSASCIVRRGPPDDVLATVAQELAADLIVVGPHRRRHGLWERLDTTVEHLVGRAGVPVLLVPKVPTQPIAHVLVPTEDATRPCAAGHWADALATHLGAPVTRLTVVSAGVPSHLLASVPMAGAAGEWAPHPEPGGRGGWIDALLNTDDGDAPARHEATFGEPGQEILVAAERCGSLIVMGRQRTGNVRRAFLGSVTREVLRGASTPVLVVPGRRDVDGAISPASSSRRTRTEEPMTTTLTPERGTAPTWHALPVDAALDALGTDVERGLAGAEVRRRLAAHGPNALVEGRRRGPLRILLAQFGDVMVLVLLGAAAIAAVLGEPEDIVAILAIVVLNAMLGFVQEYRAERAMAALRAMAAPTALVRRDGATTSIAARELVPGDVVLLEAGNLVPADLRLLEVAALEVDESALTGESLPVAKVTTTVEGADLPVGDRRNLAYNGTIVTNGRGVAVVVATGMRTELGRIAGLLAGEEEGRTPLQRRLARLGRRLAVAALVLCAAIFGIGLLRGESPVLMLMTALSLAVAAVPEALPAVVTVSLALGARKMARQHALIRRLPAVETLGSVTYICSDKTGTLTQNRMRVETLRGAAGRDIPVGMSPRERPAADARLLEALALSNDVTVGADGALRGDPTEVALCDAAAVAGIHKAALLPDRPRVAEVPFSSERARMTTVHRAANSVVAYTKGAPERVLDGCVACLTDTGAAALDREAVLAEAHRMAADGLRVLAVACRTLPSLPGAVAAVEEEQTLLGLVGLMDPPRDEARDAVATCQSAGIRVVMITGDHPATALAIARTLGIATNDDRAVTGAELARMSDAALSRGVEELRVYARVAPEDKLRIVKALQARGQFVAMTGDGVNDSVALRRAEIGIAMGRSGTDVAREAAHMILLDDNFATIVNAVREGRRIYDNLRKFVRFVLTGNSGEIWALFLAPLVGLPIPLLPIHILWVNLVTDGLPGLALAVEPAERGVMQRPPRPPAESLFAHGLWQHVLWVGLLLGGVTLAVQAWAYETGHAHWQSMTFTVLTLAQMGHVLAIRSERESFFRLGAFTNLPLLGAVALTFALQMATLYVPALQRVFRTEALTMSELLVCLAASSVVFFGVELEKWLARRGWIYRAGVADDARPAAPSPTP